MPNCKVTAVIISPSQLKILRERMLLFAVIIPFLIVFMWAIVRDKVCSKNFANEGTNPC